VVIELDDRSHSRVEVQQRDAFKNTALEAAGIRILRVNAAGGYDGAGLRERIRSEIP
jgi:very-short-patch-repair endonuclease